MNEICEDFFYEIKTLTGVHACLMSVPLVPCLKAVLLLAVLVFEVVGLPGLVVAVGDGVAVALADGLDVFLQITLLARKVNAGKVHPAKRHYSSLFYQF